MTFTPPPIVPNFVPGTTARITLDRYCFEAHLEGTNPPTANAPLQNFRHTAPQIDLSPALTFDGYGATTVQQALAILGTLITPATAPQATETTLGVIQLAGDLNGGNLATSPIVSGLRGRPLQNIIPTSGQALVWNGTSWAPATVSGAPTGAAGGGLSGTYPNPIVSKINNVVLNPTPPSAGQILTAGGATSASWVTPSITLGSDLSGSGVLTGTVPVLVSKLQGTSISSTAPITGNIWAFNSVEWVPANFARGWTTNAINVSVPTSYSTSSIAASLNVTPNITGRFRVSVSGYVENTSLSTNALTISFSHGASNYSVLDCSSVSSINVVAGGFASFSGSIDLDSANLPTPVSPTPFPVGTPVVFNVVAIATSSGMSFVTGSIGGVDYGSLQFTVQEVA